MNYFMRYLSLIIKDFFTERPHKDSSINGPVRNPDRTAPVSRLLLIYVYNGDQLGTMTDECGEYWILDGDLGRLTRSCDLAMLYSQVQSHPYVINH